MKRLSFALAVFLCAFARGGSFEILTVPEAIPESNAVTRTRVLEDKVEFSYIAPDNWIPSVDAAARRIALQARTNQLVLAIRLTTNAYPASLAKFQELIATNYVDANITEAYNTASGTGPGYGADIRHTVAGRFPMNTRLAVFPAPEGSAEVSLSSPHVPVADLHHIWTAFINSVRVQPRPPPKK